MYVCMYVCVCVCVCVCVADCVLVATFVYVFACVYMCSRITATSASVKAAQGSDTLGFQTHSQVSLTFGTTPRCICDELFRAVIHNIQSPSTETSLVYFTLCRCHRMYSFKS